MVVLRDLESSPLFQTTKDEDMLTRSAADMLLLVSGPAFVGRVDVPTDVAMNSHDVQFSR